MVLSPSIIIIQWLAVIQYFGPGLVPNCILLCFRIILHAILKPVCYKYNFWPANLIVTGSASDWMSPHLATVLFNAAVSTVETVDSNLLRVADSSVKLYAIIWIVFSGISPAAYVTMTGKLPSVSSVHRWVRLWPVQLRIHTSPWQASPSIFVASDAAEKYYKNINEFKF